MQSKAATVKEYIASLPPDRRAALEAVRAVVLKNLDKTYQEGMGYGALGWSIPHSVFPHGYHCDPRQPLPFGGIASQKNYMSIYLMSLYLGCADDGSDMSPEARWFHEAWKKTGKKLDMGKACIRFKKVEDLALDVIGEAVRRMPAKKYLAMYLKALESMGKGPDGKKLREGAGAKPAANRAAAPARKKAATKKAGAAKKKTAARR